jgi:hypothetical protein
LSALLLIYVIYKQRHANVKQMEFTLDLSWTRMRLRALHRMFRRVKEDAILL